MTDPEPCGKHHPLPCGLDESCDVPCEYFIASKDNETIVRLYKEDNDIPMADDTLPPGTTHQDIDDNFGGEEPDEWRIGLTLAVDVPAEGRTRRQAIAAALDKIPDDFDVHHHEAEDVARQ